MNRLEAFISVLEYSLDTKGKRHLIGGILMSVSLLFGGLSVTIMTLRTEDNDNEQKRIN